MLLRIFPIIVASFICCQAVWAGECADTLRIAAKRTKSILQKTEFHALCMALAKNEIRYSPETGGLVDPMENDVPLELWAKDLNGDGVREVFVHAKTSYWGGAKGDVLWLFVRHRAPRSPYETNLGFSSAGYTVLDQKHDSYPDIKVYPRAACSAIWQWSGSSYAHACNIPEIPKGCPHERPICPERLTSRVTEPVAGS